MFRPTVALALLLSLTANVLAAGPIPDEKLAEAVAATLKKKPAELKEEDLKNVFILEAATRGSSSSTASRSARPGAAQRRRERTDEPRPDRRARQRAVARLLRQRRRQPRSAGEARQAAVREGEENAIKDLKPLANLPKLVSLYLAGNEVSDLKPLAGLKKLTSLDLDRNKVTDLGPLASLTWLSTLGLRENDVTDLTPLKGMTELRFTFLEGNAIEDLSPLAAMAEKDANGDRNFAPYWRVYVAKNPLSDTAKKQQIPSLRKLGVRVEDVD